MKKNVVVHILWDGELGGVQRYVKQVLQGPYWKNFRHEIIFLKSDGVVLSQNSLLGIKCHQLHLSSGWQLLKARKLKELINEISPALIHCHCDSPAFHLFANSYSKLPLVFTEHGDTMMRRERRWVGKLLWRMQKRSWKAVIFNSHFVKEDFLRRYPWLEMKKQVLHNPLLESYGSSSFHRKGGDKVGLFARFVAQKGVDWFLQIAAQIGEKLPHVTFHLYGEGPLKDSLISKAKSLNITDRVYFHGYVSNPLEEMARMDITLIPSRIEPFGLVAVESQSVGTPVISFYKSGVAEVVIDKRTGILVPHGEVEKMAEAAVSLLSDKKRRLEMSEEAAKHAARNFSLENHIKKLEELYLSFC